MAGFFSRLFGSKKGEGDQAMSQDEIGTLRIQTGKPIVEIDDPRFTSWFDKRKDYWEKIGDVDNEVIAYLVSPQFLGAPAWPTTRQAFCVVRTGTSLIIASDGLSDLFIDTDSDEAGFCCEVYIESADLIGADFESIKASWEFALIEQFAQNVADWGGFGDQLVRYSVVSTEIPAPANLPARWATKNEMVGALINLSTPSRQSHVRLGENVVAMVPITIVTPAELDFVVQTGPQARSELALRLAQSGNYAVTRRDRDSVV